MQCGGGPIHRSGYFFQLKGKRNSQSGLRTVQTNLSFFFQDLNQKLKFPQQCQLIHNKFEF